MAKQPTKEMAVEEVEDAREKEMSSLSCPDCARLRALLKKSMGPVRWAKSATFSPTARKLLESLLARISKELARRKT